MSLQALVNETFEELERTRELFGSAPQSARFATTARLEATHAALTGQHSTAATAWTGVASRAYGESASAAIATLGRAIPADHATSAGLQSARAAASQGRHMMDDIIEQTRAGVTAIAHSTDTAAGRRQLATYLQQQLKQAQVVVQSAQHDSAATAAQIRAAAVGYNSPQAPGTGGPDDAITGDGGAPRVRAVDNVTHVPLPQNPPPSPLPAPPQPGDPLASLFLPPSAPPAPDATKRWVDDMVNELASRPPDDPVAVQARRLAWEALHKPESCSTWQWTRDSGGLLLSLGGTAVTAAGAPLGPADWAALGIALGGVGLSYGDLIDCTTKVQ